MGPGLVASLSFRGDRAVDDKRMAGLTELAPGKRPDGGRRPHLDAESLRDEALLRSRRRGGAVGRRCRGRRRLLGGAAHRRARPHEGHPARGRAARRRSASRPGDPWENDRRPGLRGVRPSRPQGRGVLRARRHGLRGRGRGRDERRRELRRPARAEGRRGRAGVERKPGGVAPLRAHGEGEVEGGQALQEEDRARGCREVRERAAPQRPTRVPRCASGTSATTRRQRPSRRVTRSSSGRSSSSRSRERTSNSSASTPNRRGGRASRRTRTPSRGSAPRSSVRTRRAATRRRP